MIGDKPRNPHFNSSFLNQSCVKFMMGDSAVLQIYTQYNLLKKTAGLYSGGNILGFAKMFS